MVGASTALISSSKLRFASLGSGSQGNATLVSCGSTLILVDCGFSMKETCIRLAKLGVEAEQLTAILITHEHQDHLKGAGALARRYKLPVYSTHGTRFTQRLGKLADWRPINPEHPFAVEDIEVRPVTVPHDAREPVQFVLSNGAKRLGLLTDLGSITPAFVEAIQPPRWADFRSKSLPRIASDGQLSAISKASDRWFIWPFKQSAGAEFFAAGRYFTTTAPNSSAFERRK